MHVIIVGCGRVGAQLAEMISLEGHDVVVVDVNARSFRRLGSSFNGVTMVGNGFDPEDLKKAGIEETDAFAAVTNFDNTNVMAAQVARNLYHVPKVVARIYNPDRLPTLEGLGLNVVCGTTMVAQAVKKRLFAETFQTLYVFPEGDFEIAQFRAGKKLAGKKASSLKEKSFQVVAVKREGKVYLPHDIVLKEDDFLVINVSLSHLKEVDEYFSEG